MVSENDIENAICQNPEKYLGEEGLRLISRQYRIGNYIFDLLFEDRHGAKLIIEIQKGVLDRNHTYKILDYYHEYKDKNPHDFVELMVIANEIPKEIKRRLSQFGVSFKEIPESEFIEIIASNVEETDQLIEPKEETKMPPFLSKDKSSSGQKKGFEICHYKGQGLSMDTEFKRIIDEGRLIGEEELHEISQATNLPVSRVRNHISHIRRHPHHNNLDIDQFLKEKLRRI